MYFELLDNDIENLEFGLKDFEEKENYIPKLKDVLEHKKYLINMFRKYKDIALDYKEKDDMVNFVNTCIIVCSFKSRYKNCCSDSVVDYIENGEDIIDKYYIANGYDENFTCYLWGLGY